MAIRTPNPAGPASAQLPRARGRFISHVFTLLTGNGIAQGINVIGTLLLARLFVPAAFGFFALFTTLVSFVSVLGGGRYELAIMLPEEDREAANVFIGSTLVLCGISGISAVLIGLLQAPIARLLGNTQLGGWLWAAPVAIFINGFYQVLNSWSGRMKRFRRIAVARVSLSAGTIAGQLVLLLLHMSAGFALVGGWLFGWSLGTSALLLPTVAVEGRFIVKEYNRKVLLASLKKYKNFPIYKAPYSFVVNASSRLVLVILRVFETLGTVGLYSMASRAILLPSSLIASSLNQVFYEKAASEFRSGFGRLEQFVTRVLRVQIVLGTPFLILFAFDARLLFRFFLGEKWAAVGVYAAILAFAGYSYFVASWLDRLFDISGRQRLSLVLEVVGKTATLGGLALTLWLTRNAVLAVGAFAILETILSATWLFFSYRVAGFKISTLGLLVRDAFTSALVAGLVVVPLHAVFHAWWAFGSSLIAVLFIDAVAFSRYVTGGRAFPSTADRFHQFWAHAPGALHHRETPDFYAAEANELKRLFPTPPPQCVLDIGCGDGTLFSYLQVPELHYKGVDFAQHFLDRFRGRHPKVSLECAEGASYFDTDQQYDLILLNEVIQHFDRAMLETHLGNARKMMHGQSVLLWTFIPHRAFRTHYDMGFWSEAEEPNVFRWWKSRLRRFLGLDLMGFWYRPDAIAELAENYGLEARFALSAASPYRFHVQMKLKSPHTRSVLLPSIRRSKEPQHYTARSTAS
jgi:lipopolysaccharide exporter